MVTQTKPTITDMNADDMQQAIAASAVERLAADRLAHFGELAGGEWAEYSAQVRYAESVAAQLITGLEIDGFNGSTVAIQIETGRHARCYGRNTMMKRIDNGNTVVSVVIHLSIFSLEFEAFVFELAHAIAHTLAYTRSDKVEFGMSVSGTHNKAFKDEFNLFGATSLADRTTKQNLPETFSDDTLNVIARMNVDHGAVILTAEATPKAKRTPATVIRLACPTDAAHFNTSNIEKRYKGKRPIINLKCGKCDTKITAAGYKAHADTK